MARPSREESSPSPVSSEEGRLRERRLVEATQYGDGKAYGLLIRLHQKRLFRFVFGLVGSFDQTEDIVQEAFVKGYQAIGRFRIDLAFYPWIATIARNLAFNQMARDQKQESMEKMQEKGFDPASVELGPLDNLLDGENQKRFYRAVAALPEKFRVVFAMRHFEDMNYTDIASALKIPPGTVDSRLFRARKMLLEELKDLL